MLKTYLHETGAKVYYKDITNDITTSQIHKLILVLIVSNNIKNSTISMNVWQYTSSWVIYLLHNFVYSEIKFFKKKTNITNQRNILKLLLHSITKLPIKIDKRKSYYERRNARVAYKKWRILKWVYRKNAILKRLHYIKKQKTNIYILQTQAVKQTNVAIKKQFNRVYSSFKKNVNWVWRKELQKWRTHKLEPKYLTHGFITKTTKHLFLEKLYLFIQQQNYNKFFKTKFIRRLKSQFKLNKNMFTKTRYKNLYKKPTQNIHTVSNNNAITFKQIYKLAKNSQHNLTNIVRRELKKFTTTIKPTTTHKLKLHIFANLFNINNKVNSAITPVNVLNNTSLLTTNIFNFKKGDQKTADQLWLLNNKGLVKNFINFAQNTSQAVREQSNLYTNYLPLFCALNPNEKQNATLCVGYSTLISLYTHKKNTYKTFFLFYLTQFLERYLNKKIWVRVDIRNPINIFWRSYINNFIKQYNHLYRKFSRLIDVHDLLEILVITFNKQDLNILLFFLKKRIEQAHFKKHKKILSIFFDVLRKNKVLLTLNNAKGFSFDIRGKVGVSGNAKKRHLFFSFGKITTTTQNIRSQWQQINVWTATGQMGITCLIQY